MYSIMVMIKGVRRPGEGLEEPEQCQQGGWKGMEQLDGAPQEAKQGRHTCRETAGWGGEKPGWEEEVDHPRPARWAAAPSGHFLPLPGPTRPSSPNQCHLVGPNSVYSPDALHLGSFVQSILKESSPEYSLEGLMQKLKLQYFGHLMQKTDSLDKTLIEKDGGQEEKGATEEDEMVGWHHGPDGHEFEQALGVGDGQGSLACCSPWGHKELDTTE